MEQLVGQVLLVELGFVFSPRLPIDKSLSLTSTLCGLLLANPLLFGAPFLFAGGLKIVYDLLLYRSFRTLRPPEETPR